LYRDFLKWLIKNYSWEKIMSNAIKAAKIGAIATIIGLMEGFNK
jgi:hypothetical protein